MSEDQLSSQGNPVLEHSSQALLDRLAADGGPPIYSLTPEEARSGYYGLSPPSVLQMQLLRIGRSARITKPFVSVLFARTPSPVALLSSCTFTVLAGSWAIPQLTSA